MKGMEITGHIVSNVLLSVIHPSDCSTHAPPGGSGHLNPWILPVILSIEAANMCVMREYCSVNPR